MLTYISFATMSLPVQSKSKLKNNRVVSNFDRNPVEFIQLDEHNVHTVLSVESVTLHEK